MIAGKLDKTIDRGTRRAILSPLMSGRWTVWVGYVSPNGDQVGAHWFKGFSTCGAEYGTEKTALRAAEKFLSH